MINMYEADESDEQPTSPRNLDMETRIFLAQ